jgi:hypothetical protein
MSSLVTEHDGQKQVRGERSEQHDAEEGPATVDLLDREVLLSREVDLVGELEEMCAGRHQRDCRQDEGGDLRSFQPHDTRSL